MVIFEFTDLLFFSLFQREGEGEGKGEGEGEGKGGASFSLLV